MNHDPVTRTVVAAALLICPVAFQLVASDAADSTTGHLTFALTQLVGWALVWTVAGRIPVPARRRARFGRIAVFTGVGCQVVFALTYGATALDGEPMEAAFLFFLLGFLALDVGGITWGSALLRTSAGRTAGAGLVAVGVLGLLAVLVGVDPFHDTFLLASYAAWVLVAAGLRTSASQQPDAAMAG